MVNIDFINGWIKGGGDVLYYCKMWTMIIISGRYGEWFSGKMILAFQYLFIRFYTMNDKKIQNERNDFHGKNDLLVL